MGTSTREPGKRVCLGDSFTEKEKWTVFPTKEFKETSDGFSFCAGKDCTLPNFGT